MRILFAYLGHQLSVVSIFLASRTMRVGHHLHKSDAAGSTSHPFEFTTTRITIYCHSLLLFSTATIYYLFRVGFKRTTSWARHLHRGVSDPAKSQSMLRAWKTFDDLLQAKVLITGRYHSIRLKLTRSRNIAEQTCIISGP